MRVRTVLAFILVFVVFPAALGLVTWRQSRTREALAELERIRRDMSIALAEKVESERRIQVLASRQRVVPLARERLGMHTPEGSELVLLPVEWVP